MARRSISIDEKIARQKQVVFKDKDKYDADVAELDRLEKKRDEIRKKELLDAITNSNRSFDEIMEFLKNDPEDDSE